MSFKIASLLCVRFTGSHLGWYENYFSQLSFIEKRSEKIECLIPFIITLSLFIKGH